MRKKLIHWCKNHWLEIVIWVGTLLVVNWIILTKEIFYTHDYLHGARIAEMTRGLLEGQIPVIWSQNFGFGFGMPIFEFYAPLPYFIGAIFHLLGFNLIWSTKLLFILTNIVTMIGMYLWARQFFDSRTSSLSAAMLTLASYRAMDMFARGAMSELWGIMALPWLLAGITQIALGKKYGYWAALFGGVMLALSHNVTLMIAAPTILLYSIIIMFWARQSQKLDNKTWRRHWLTLILAGGSVLATTAFYWLPAFMEKNLTQLSTYILDNYYYYHLHFLYVRQFVTNNFGYGGSGWGPDDGLSFFLGFAQLTGFALSLLVVIIYLYRYYKEQKHDKKYRQNVLNIVIYTFVSILFGLTLFMTLYKSEFIWDALESLLAFTQFPWRFLGISISLLSFVAVLGITLLPPKWQPTFIIALWLLLVGTSYSYFRGDRYLEPTQCVVDDSNCVAATPYYRDDPDYIRASMSPILVDYLPAAFANYKLDDKNEVTWASVDTQVYELDVEQQPSVLVDRMHEKLYQYDLEASREAEFALAYYPGMKAEINGQPAAIKISDHGNVKLDIPAGETKVGLYLDSTPVRRLANWLSLVSSIAVISWGVYGVCQKKNN